MVDTEKMGVRGTKGDGRGMMEDVVARLRTFIENEMRSCSMDYGCITPEYVQRITQLMESAFLKEEPFVVYKVEIS